MSVSVCLSVCLAFRGRFLSENDVIHKAAYLRNYRLDIQASANFPCTCYLSSWLGPPLAALRYGFVDDVKCRASSNMLTT